MQMASFVEALQSDLEQIAAVGDDATSAAAQRLAGALKASAGLRLLDVLTEAALELSVQLPEGHVEVRLAGQDPTLVYVEDTPQQAPPSADDALQAEGGSADVQAAGRYASVQVQTGSGDVAVATVDGDAKLKSGSGDLALERVDGELSAQTGSGDVSIGRTGHSAAVRSASGDVAVRDATLELTVQTASGDVSIEAVSVGEVSVQSASGDVSVGVRKGRTLWVDAKSMSGETTSDFAVGEAPGEPEEEEGPLVELRIQTMSGDIHIGRAAERAELER